MATRPPANITNRSNGPFRVPGGLGEQPSITDRDPGDESEAACRQWLMAHPIMTPVDPETRIEALEAEVQHLHQAHEQYVAAQRVLTKNACDWRDAEIAKLRADLAKWSRQQTVPEGSFW